MFDTIWRTHEVGPGMQHVEQTGEAERLNNEAFVAAAAGLPVERPRSAGC
jgi:hypothetical protein